MTARNLLLLLPDIRGKWDTLPQKQDYYILSPLNWSGTEWFAPILGWIEFTILTCSSMTWTLNKKGMSAEKNMCIMDNNKMYEICTEHTPIAIIFVFHILWYDYMERVTIELKGWAWSDSDWFRLVQFHLQLIVQDVRFIESGSWAGTYFSHCGFIFSSIFPSYREKISSHPGDAGAT